MAEPAWHITPLALEDCDELGGVHVQVWREAYAGIMPADHLAGLSAERSADRWRETVRVLSEGRTTARTLVARDATGRIVGFASAGPSRDEDPAAAWELYAINLLSRTHGTGLADELINRVVGDGSATLWVAEGNTRARAFYARHGFAVEGARRSHEDTGTPEVRMIRLS